MLLLNLPKYETKIAIRDGKKVIFDVIRRRYVALTPEEWVRQHFVHFLIDQKGYPVSLMANEVWISPILTPFLFISVKYSLINFPATSCSCTGPNGFAK